MSRWGGGSAGRNPLYRSGVSWLDGENSSITFSDIAMKCCSLCLVILFAIVTLLPVSAPSVSAFSFQEFGDKISKETQKLRRGVGLADEDEEKTVCDAGNYKKSEDSMACIPCPLGTYADAKGATQCTACPDGTTTAKPGADSVNTCSAQPTATDTTSEAAEK